MRISQIPLFLFGALPLAVFAGGCTVQTNDRVAPATVIVSDGTLTVDWTINGVKDYGERCDLSAARSIQIDVQTTGGLAVGSYTQLCSAYATSISLAPGNYVAAATLIDSAGNARTTSVQLNPFSILGNDDIITPIDFPTSSFY